MSIVPPSPPLVPPSACKVPLIRMKDCELPVSPRKFILPPVPLIPAFASNCVPDAVLILCVPTVWPVSAPLTGNTKFIVPPFSPLTSSLLPAPISIAAAVRLIRPPLAPPAPVASITLPTEVLAEEELATEAAPAEGLPTDICPVGPASRVIMPPMLLTVCAWTMPILLMTLPIMSTALRTVIRIAPPSDTILPLLETLFEKLPPAVFAGSATKNDTSPLPAKSIVKSRPPPKATVPKRALMSASLVVLELMLATFLPASTAYPDGTLIWP